MKYNESLLTVGLIGCDYSGSTILSAVIDGFNDVQSVGETHWIIDSGASCRECGDSECPVFNELLLSKLRGMSADDIKQHWWSEISLAANARVILSSDKRPTHFKRLGFPERYILTYKDPVSQVHSKVKRAAKEAPSLNTTDSLINQSIDWYVKHMENRVTFLENIGRKTALVKNEDLVQKTDEVISGLSHFMDTEAAEGAADYWKHRHHYIGGNFSVKAIASAPGGDESKRLKLDDSVEMDFSNAQIEMIMKNESIQTLMNRVESGPERLGWETIG